jgi:hypothetical protein
LTDDQSEGTEQLLPVDPHHLLATLSFALTRDSRLAKTQAADVMASSVAKRIVSSLEAANYVVMRRALGGDMHHRHQTRRRLVDRASERDEKQGNTPPRP